MVSDAGLSVFGGIRRVVIANVNKFRVHFRYIYFACYVVALNSGCVVRVALTNAAEVEIYIMADFSTDTTFREPI